MHQNGVVPHLLRLIGNYRLKKTSETKIHSYFSSILNAYIILIIESKNIFIGSEDEDVQEASADCLQNIRKLALACEKFRYQHMKA